MSARRGSGLVLCVGCAIVCVLPLQLRAPWLGTIPIAVSAVFYVNALVLKDDAGRGGATSWMLGFAAFLWPTSYLFEWQGPLAIRASMIGSSAFWWVMARAFLLYPRQHLDWPERLYLAMLGLGLGVPEVILLLSDNQYHDIPYFNVYIGVLGLAILVVATRRLKKYQGLERRALIPLLITGMFIGGSGGVSWSFLLEKHIHTPLADQSAIDLIYLVQGLVLLSTPVAFAVIGLHRRFVQAAIAHELTLLPSDASVGQVQNALREALRDKRLRLLYWTTATDCYLDANERPCERPEKSCEEVHIEIKTAGGDRLALLIANKELAREAALAGNAITSTQTSLLALWLQSNHSAKQAEHRALARRLEEVRWAERERFSRDLHDGMQQRLLALGMSLARMSHHVSGPKSVTDDLNSVQNELDCVLQDMRGLAHQIAPALLRERGLKVAVQSMTARMDLFVCAKYLTDERLHPAVEFLAYNVLAECLTNTIKHANATHAIIRSESRDGVFQLEFADDGKGGAHRMDSSGLSGLRDRVVAMDGQFEILSPLGAGTRVIARIPCE